MKRSAKLAAAAAGLCLVAQSITPVRAGPLTDLMNDPDLGSSFGSIDRTMAVALDAAAIDIAQVCPGTGAPCPFPGLAALGTSINRLYAQIGQLPNSNNPQADLAAIGGALRGGAPEELSALRLLSNEFASDQRDQIRSRLNARRLGATGLALNLDAPGPLALSARQRPRVAIGAAGADDVPGDFSRWGGYLNLQLADGERDATALEDGFDLSGTDIALGADYLLRSSTVLGAMLNYTDRKAVFEGGADTQGRIASSGLSLVAYGSREWDGLYLSGSAGYQWQSNHIRRFLHFTLPLPVLDAINTGSTDSGALTVTMDAGRMFQKGAFGFEPTARFLYRHTRFDAFVEDSIDLATDGPSGFALAFDKSSAETLNGSFGMRANYVLNGSFGVVVPYAQYELRHEFSKHAMKTQADFADLLAAGLGSPSSSFELKSDRPDSTYHVVEAGASVVFKHGVQAFLNARSLLGLRRADLLVVSAGVRAEF